jgi:hypothetical protein
MHTRGTLGFGHKGKLGFTYIGYEQPLLVASSQLHQEAGCSYTRDSYALVRNVTVECSEDTQRTMVAT